MSSLYDVMMGVKAPEDETAAPDEGTALEPAGGGAEAAAVAHTPPSIPGAATVGCPATTAAGAASPSAPGAATAIPVVSPSLAPASAAPTGGVTTAAGAAELCVEKFFKEAAMGAVLNDGPLQTADLLQGLASNLKELTVEDPGVRAAARAEFIRLFAGRPGAALAGPAFDIASEKGAWYLELKELGLPGNVASVMERSPAKVAKQEAYEQIIPGGLRDGYAVLVALLRLGGKVVGGKLEYNEMTEAATVDRHPLDDSYVDVLRERIENAFDGKDSKGHEVPLQFGVGNVERAIEQVGKEHRYHPVREYLLGLRWDGTPRLDRVAAEILKADDNNLNRTLVRKFFIGAAARILKPGCKLDTVLILVGPQGKLKSSFFQLLASPAWFSDEVINMHDKDSMLLLRSVWILEWAELESMLKARNTSAVKSFVSKQVDKFRRPYGRRIMEAPRHAITVGTTNEDYFISDDTGTRRWWPIDVGAVDLERTAKWRDQLWAEAVVAYAKGEPWWLDDAEEAERAKRTEKFEREDPWQYSIEAWLSQNDGKATSGVTTAEILAGAIQKPTDRSLPSDEQRVGGIMKRLGFEGSRHRQTTGQRPRVWVRCSSRMSPVRADPVPEPQPGGENPDLR